MTDTDLIDRVTAVESRVHELERLTYHDLADILNIRFAQIDRSISELKEQSAVASQRLSKLDHATTLLQADVRDLRNGMTAQFRAIGEQLKSQGEQLRSHDERLQSIEGQLKSQGEQLRSHDERLKSIEEQLKSQGEQLRSHDERLKSIEEQLKSQGEQLKSQGEQLKSQDTKLDAILAKLGA